MKGCYLTYFQLLMHPTVLSVRLSSFPRTAHVGRPFIRRKSLPHPTTWLTVFSSSVENIFVFYRCFCYYVKLDISWPYHLNIRITLLFLCVVIFLRGFPHYTRLLVGPGFWGFYKYCFKFCKYMWRSANICCNSDVSK